MFHRDQPTVRLRRPVRGGMLHQLHARMNRLPAHLTREDDWKEAPPGVRLSRVFGVVLGIHVIAIGGLMAYEMFRHREPVADSTAAFRPAARELRPGMAPTAAAARVLDTFADDPTHDGMRKHVVAPGERLADIAALYGVDEKALLVKNRLGDGRAFRSGIKLVIPNQQLHPSAPVAPDQLLAGQPAAAPNPAVIDTPPASETARQDPVDAMVAVDRRPYDPKLPTRRAEPVGEPAAPRATTTKSPARPAKPPTSAVAASTRQSTTPPSKKATAAAAPAKNKETAASKPKSKGRVHVVKDGENAYRIAKAYGVNLDQLIKTNGINPAALRPGTTLTIPPSR